METTELRQRFKTALTTVPTAAWVGFLGSAILALGRILWMTGSDSGLHQTWWARRLHEAFDDHAAGAITALGASVILLAWMLLRVESRAGKPRFLLVFVAWVLPILPLAGILSSDPRYYADIGWMVNLGFDPYSTGLGTTGSPFNVGATWHDTFAVYPSLALRLMALVVLATGAHWYWSVVAMRVLALIGVGLLAWSVPKLAAVARVDARFAIWLAIFNPLTFLHGVGGMHIDMLMCGLVAVALVVATRPRGLLWGILAVGIAAAVKQPALAAAIPVAILSARPNTGWPRFLVRVAVAVGGAVAVLGATSWLTGLGVGWIRATQTPYSVLTVGPAYLMGKAITVGLTLLGRPAPVSVIETCLRIGMVITAVIMLVVFVRNRNRPFQFLAAAGLAWAIGSGAFREWYLLLWICFVPFATLGKWMRRAVSFLVPFAAVYSAFKSYLDWDIVPAFCVSAALAVAANANGWLLGDIPGIEAESPADIDAGDKEEPGSGDPPILPPSPPR